MFAGICFPEEPAFQDSVTDFLRICTVSRGFTGARIGLVGPRPERFETCIFSEDLLMRKFQQRVIPISLPDIMSIATSPENRTEIEKISEEMKTQSESSAVDTDTVLNIAGLECALSQFASEKGLSGMGIQCWTAMQKIYGISPCYAMGRLTDHGIMTSCEVDIYGVLTMLIQYLVSLGTTVPHFIDWTIKHQEQENVFLAWHCGNGPPSLVSDGNKLTLSYQSVLGKTLGIDNSYGTGEYQLKPGDVTLCRLQEHDGQFKMLVAKGKIVPSQQELRGTWSWVEVPDLDKLYNTLVNEGFTHHASMIHGDFSRSITNACNYLGITPVVV
jgi:L-fucose isomerase-like protein